MDIDTDPKVKDERVIRAQRLVYELAQYTTIELFALDCASIWDNWVSLLSQTTFPLETSSRDSRYTLAFQAIEKVISTTHGISQWLAYKRPYQATNGTHGLRISTVPLTLVPIQRLPVHEFEFNNSHPSIRQAPVGSLLSISPRINCFGPPQGRKGKGERTWPRYVPIFA